MGTEKPSRDERAERVHESIEKTLSSERDDAPEGPGTAVDDRKPIAMSEGSPEAQAATRKRLAEIEAHVGKLVDDPQIEKDAAERSR